MTENKRFKPYNLEDYKTVKQWKEWLEQFDDDCKVKTILKKGDATYIEVDAWTSNLAIFMEVIE